MAATVKLRTAEPLSTLLVRWYFLSLAMLAVVTALSCWVKICVLLKDQGRRNSVRAQLLLNTLLVSFNYCVSWLPYFLLVGLGGSLDGGSLTEGFKKDLSDFNCHLNDASVRGAVAVVVVSSAIYFRYIHSGEGGRGIGDGYMLMGGLTLPWIAIILTRVLLAGQEWRTRTYAMLREGSNGTFTMKANMLFCETHVNIGWVNHVMAEWLLTLLSAGLAAFWVLPVRQGSQDYSKRQKKADGLFASGEYYMESVSVIAVMWFLTIRPLLAWSIFISTNEGWSSYLDIPSHALIILSAALVPFEVEDRWAEGAEPPAGDGEVDDEIAQLAEGAEGAKGAEEKKEGITITD
ncbi:uncharacterized protein LOC122249760 isoform X2 [Penaeus japonicus]|uniref:uncharacterized protein LOC122249760 isoform X2 n=1 Tax=Penaeus japonicus TaxID=27405 RepID=UPI001C70FD5B|nr:uncharacterized protein LOC122249760 isoform X2 [Penaeus japonicus]